MTCKTLANKLNTVNNTNDIKVAKENIKMVYKWWTMQGMKVTTIKGVC